MAQEPGLSDLILRIFLLRHSILMSRGTGLTLIGSRFDPDTRRLLEVLARNRLVWTWLDLEASPEAEQILQGLDILCVPKTSSRSCDQTIFVDQATDTSAFSDVV
jgi:thioredoxin reductase (NADPH)